MTPQPSKTPLTTVVATVVLLAVAGYMLWSEQRTPASDPGPAEASRPAPRPDAAREPRAPEPPAAEPETAEPRTPEPQATEPRSRGVAAAGRDTAHGPVMRNQRIRDEQGRLVYEGAIDLGPVFARIAAGDRDSHRNDGTTFANREGRLPKQPRGYYTEWVVRTDGVRGVGPQRLITGKDGEAFYTPDHYETFIRVRGPS